MINNKPNIINSNTTCNNNIQAAPADRLHQPPIMAWLGPGPGLGLGLGHGPDLGFGLRPGLGHGIDHWPEPPAVPAEFMVSELSSPVKPGTARATQISTASSATIVCRSDDMPFTDQPNMPSRTRL